MADQKRVLVVGNQTLLSESLAEKLREVVAAGSCAIHVVVPATPASDHLVWTEGEAQALAEERLESALGKFREICPEVDGEVGPASPVESVQNVISGKDFDEILLSTFPPGVSKWLGLDLPHRLARAVSIPVTHVVADPEP